MVPDPAARSTHHRVVSTGKKLARMHFDYTRLGIYEMRGFFAGGAALAAIGLDSHLAA